MRTVTNQANSSEPNSVPKTLLKQLVDAASNGTTFQVFLQTHLDDAVQGAVSPRYILDKPQTIKRFSEVFAMVAGGTATLVTVGAEGVSACGRIVLTKKKHDLKYTQKINVQAEVVIEASIWLEVNPAGKIVQLHLVGDMLTPALAMGMQMVNAPRSDVEPNPA